jgi:hypothetical protein
VCPDMVSRKQNSLLKVIFLAAFPQTWRQHFMTSTPPLGHTSWHLHWGASFIRHFWRRQKHSDQSTLCVATILHSIIGLSSSKCWLFLNYCTSIVYTFSRLGAT